MSTPLLALPDAVEGVALTEVTSGASRTYRVPEWGHIEVEPAGLLRDGKLDVYASVVGRDYFTLRPQQGALMLQAGSYIGVIPLNELVTLEVTPRVPLRNLSRLLRVSGNVPLALPETARLYEREAEMYPSLLDLYAQALGGYVDQIRLRGLAREYVERHENTSFPRGRILMNETVKSLRPKGISYKLATSWYQRTSDIASNQCVKYAIWFLARCLARAQTAQQSRRALRTLNRAYRVFDGIELDLSRGFMRDPVVLGLRPLPSVRSYYHPALALCLAIIQQQGVSLDQRSGDLSLPSLILKMSDVFEDYVRNVLARYATAEGWTVSVLNGNHRAPQGGEQKLFHEGMDADANPDIVLALGTGEARTHPLVLEVKYKPSDRSIDRDDLHQAIAYGISYRCKKVVLVHPRGAKTDAAAVGLRELGRLNDMVVYQYVYDLSTHDLVGQENQFGQRVAALVAS